MSVSRNNDSNEVGSVMELEEIRDWHNLTQVQMTQTVNVDAAAASSLPTQVRYTTGGELAFLDFLEVAELVMVQPVAYRVEHEEAVSTDFPIHAENELTVVYERGIDVRNLEEQLVDEGNGALLDDQSNGQIVSNIDSIWRADYTLFKEFEDTTNGTAGGGSGNVSGSMEPFNLREQFGHGPIINDEPLELACRIDLPGNAEGSFALTTALNLYFDTYELEETVKNVVG